MSALVLLVIGQSRRAQKRKSQRAVLACVAVLAVVEQRNAVAELGDVCEAMTADFELRSVPSRVAVRRPLDESELILVRAVRGQIHVSCDEAIEGMSDSPNVAGRSDGERDLPLQEPGG